MKEAVVLSLAIIFASIGDILFSRGMQASGGMKFSSLQDIPVTIRYILTNKVILAGIAVMAMHLCSYITVLAWMDISVANPITALSYVLVTGYAALVIRENVAPGRWIGVMLITLGVVLVGLSS